MPEESADREKVADAVLDKVKHFTIGFALAGDTPAAKGSGVLIKHGERYGILTCAHVDAYLRTLNRPVGIVRLNRGLAEQAATLAMEEVFTYAAGEAPWTEGADDVAFIHLPPHLVGNIEKDCVFLDAEKNFTKPQPEDFSSLPQVHSVFGLVEEFTGATTRQGGRNNLAQGRANFRGLTRVRQADRDVGMLQRKPCRFAIQLWRHERRRLVAGLRA